MPDWTFWPSLCLIFEVGRLVAHMPPSLTAPRPHVRVLLNILHIQITNTCIMLKFILIIQSKADPDVLRLLQHLSPVLLITVASLAAGL